MKHDFFKILLNVDNSKDHKYKVLRILGCRVFSFKNHRYYKDAIERIDKRTAFFENYLKFKQEFNVSLPAEACGYGTKFELVKCKLKDLKCKNEKNGEYIKINETAYYKYLESQNPTVYTKRIEECVLDGMFSENTQMRSVKKYKTLIKSIDKNGYDPSKSVICISGDDNFILSGWHRASYLYYKYGPDYELLVVKIWR
ncbi:MAG: hypothetical protein MJ158_03220 [Alphaproteobacteria bacterium]|nr:hypothetical protein [Alphaproteobacteria bacterium]